MLQNNWSRLHGDTISISGDCLATSPARPTATHTPLPSSLLNTILLLWGYKDTWQHDFITQSCSNLLFWLDHWNTYLLLTLNSFIPNLSSMVTLRLTRRLRELFQPITNYLLLIHCFSINIYLFIPLSRENPSIFPPVKNSNPNAWCSWKKLTPNTSNGPHLILNSFQVKNNFLCHAKVVSILNFYLRNQKEWKHKRGW